MKSSANNEELEQDLLPTDLKRLPGRYMSFRLAGEEYGMSILKVREIIGLQESTPIPRMPDYIKGVVNLRGRIIPLIDLRLKLGLGECEKTHETCTIVTEVESSVEGEFLNIACIVDAVSEVIEFKADEIEPPPQLGINVDVSFLLGMGKIKEQEKVVNLIDINRVLADLAVSPSLVDQQAEV